VEGAWIDVTVPVRTGMVCWPDDPPVRVDRVSDVDRGDEATVSRLSLGAHTGTHVDAPAHFLRGGAGVDAIPIDATVGPARVVLLPGVGAIGPDQLAAIEPVAGERILLHTDNSALWRSDRFSKRYAHLTTAAAELLVDRRVRTIGIDYLSIEAFGAPGHPAHRVLLAAGVCILEGLDLSAVDPGDYDLVCLPLRVAGADGAPARAVLRRRAREAR
jgi:arylformamidase